MNQTNNPIRLIGAGGHAKVVLSTLEALGLLCDGIFDDDPATWGKQILGIKIKGPVEKAGTEFPCVAAVGKNATRQKIVKRLQGARWISLVHPFAHVHSSVELGEGSVVFAGAVIQPDTLIGSHSIINTGSTIDHDCKIGDFVHLAPGTHLAGNVLLETGVFMGIGACGIPGVRVGEWAQVGAGATVIRNLPPGCLAIGTPARIRTCP